MAPSERERAAEAMAGQGQRDNYATAVNLARRQALFDYPDPERSSGRPPIERIEWTGNERVLDAGCGNGVWLKTLRERFGVDELVGIDLSAGMLRSARELAGTDVALAVGDVQRLPLDDESVDVVLCFWMLYHVDNHLGALSEFRRVLRPGGRLLAATNSAEPRPLDRLITGVLNSVTGQDRHRWVPGPSFSQENGAAIVAQVFDRVAEERTVVAFAIETPEPVLGVLESLRRPIEIFSGEPIDWAAVEEMTRRSVQKAIDDEGAFRTTIASASFLALKEVGRPAIQGLSDERRRSG